MFDVQPDESPVQKQKKKKNENMLVFVLPLVLTKTVCLCLHFLRPAMHYYILNYKLSVAFSANCKALFIKTNEIHSVI